MPSIVHFRYFSSVAEINKGQPFRCCPGNQSGYVGELPSETEGACLFLNYRNFSKERGKILKAV